VAQPLFFGEGRPVEVLVIAGLFLPEGGIVLDVFFGCPEELVVVVVVVFRLFGLVLVFLLVFFRFYFLLNDDLRFLVFEILLVRALGEEFV